MLQLTKEATRHLVTVRRERGVDEGAGARLVSKGARIGLTFAEAPSAGDVVVDGGEILVYVAADLAPALRSATIDTDESDGRRGLVIRNRARYSSGQRPN